MTSLKPLTRSAERVTIVSEDTRRLEELRQEAKGRGIRNVVALPVMGFTKIPVPNRSAGLVWVAGEDDSLEVKDYPELVPELKRILRSDGAAYFELSGFREHLPGRQMLRELRAGGFGAIREFWVTPWEGEVRTLFPSGDHQIAEHFFGNVLIGLSFRKRAMSQVGETLSRLKLLRNGLLRHGVIVHRTGASNGHSEPPKYLQDLAAREGLDLKRHRVGLSARGHYNSNKIIFYLFGTKQPNPEAIVKVTRAPEYNYRLENEARALRLLNEKRLLEAGRYPELLLFGYHNQHAVLSQRAVEGHPFRKSTTARPDCPIARDALDALVELGRRSANTGIATAAGVAEVLRELFERFQRIYRLPQRESDFLREQIAKVAVNRALFPTVFQHGDPGTWNLIVSGKGRVTFLDWETAEPRGIPLWDLFYFLRSFGTWISRKQGLQDRETSFAENFLTATPLSQLFKEATEKYCAATHLDTELVEPLFHTCWMYRALKECTRLPADKLHEGVFIKLLRLCITKRDALAILLPFVEDHNDSLERRSLQLRSVGRTSSFVHSPCD